MYYISVTYPDDPKLLFIFLVGIVDGQVSGIVPSFNLYQPLFFWVPLFSSINVGSQMEPCSGSRVDEDER